MNTTEFIVQYKIKTIPINDLWLCYLHRERQDNLSIGIICIELDIFNLFHGKISSILYYMYLSIYSLVYFIIKGITIPCPHFFKNPKWLNNNPEPNYFNLESSRCTFQIIAEPRLFPRIFVVGSKDELVSSCQNVFLVDLWFAECLK